MQELEELKQRYDAYIETVKKVRARANPMAELFGLGAASKNDSCHRIFYDEAGEIVTRLAQAAPSPEEAAEAVDWLLRAPEIYASEQQAAWMLMAAQGHARSLIPFLSPTDALQLAVWYQAHYPKRMRLPVQEQLFNALKKRGKE